MKNNLGAGIVGFVFALGLGASGMTQPQKIVGFLNVFGAWDPALIFVMIGSIVVHFVLYRLIKQRTSPLFSAHWHLPKKSRITPSLVIGSILFGVGWGLAGYCPGPAIVSLASFELRPFLFVLSMMGGMLIFKILDRKFGFNR